MRDVIHQKRRAWTKPVVLIVILMITALCAVYLWTRPASQPALDAGRQVADTFLTQLRDGRPEQAWTATTAEFKSAQGKESFVRQVKPVKYLKEPLIFVSVQTVQVGDSPRTEYLYQAATGENVRLVLGRDGQSWKVDRWSPTGSAK